MKRLILLLALLSATRICPGQSIEELEKKLRTFKTYRCGENLDIARRLLAQDPLNAPAVTYITDYYHYCADTPDSVSAFFDDLTAAHPQSPLPHLYRAKYEQVKPDHHATVIDYLKRGFALDSCNYEINLLLGEEYYDAFHRKYNSKRKPETDRYAREAIRSFERADKIDGKQSLQTWASLIQLYNYTNAPMQAERLMKTPPEGSPYFPLLAFGEMPDRSKAEMLIFGSESLPADWPTRYDINMFWAAQSSSFTSGLYTKLLDAMNEPSLWQDATESQVRFLWLRSFDDPVSIRLEKKNGKATLYWKSINRNGAYEPGKMTKNRKRRITLQQCEDYIALLEKAGYFGMKTIYEEELGNDGASWVLEANIDGKYHIVERWCGAEIKNLCLRLLKLTKMKIREDDIY
ncbi:hypothetical protein [uncultured Alistipes sp.]|jgi:hypothetical protein|uniref:hypothetical protein n=1 Tax=uncultured Alistipes sp. TaxID=538949 RepID=UPI0025CFC778|nr:hypothetical protein [uncultured Alistipes sp.]